MKKSISLLLSLVMLLSCLCFSSPAWAKSLPKSGKCGDSITFSFSEKTGTLTLSGKGSMYKKPKALKPFCNNKKVKKIVVKNGIKNIDNDCFRQFKGLEKAVIADSVVSIGYAFSCCRELKSIKLPKNLEKIEMNAFYYTPVKKIKIPAGCFIEPWAFSESGVESVIFESGTEVVPNEAFYQTGMDIYGLQEMYLPKSVKVFYLNGNYSSTTYYEGTKEELKKIDVLENYDDEGGDPIYSTFPTYEDLGGVYCNTSIKMKIPTVKNKSKGKKSFSVTVNEVKGMKGYEIQYSRGETISNSKWAYYKAHTKKLKGKSVTVKKLKSGNTYYFRVRAYKIKNGKKIYSRWSKIQSVKIK